MTSESDTALFRRTALEVLVPFNPFDLAPKNWTLECEFSQTRLVTEVVFAEVTFLAGKEKQSEGYTTQRRADHRDPEARGGRIGDDRAMPSAGHQRADLLPLEGEVRRDGIWGCEETQTVWRRKTGS